MVIFRRITFLLGNRSLQRSLLNGELKDWNAFIFALVRGRAFRPGGWRMRKGALNVRERDFRNSERARLFWGWGARRKKEKERKKKSHLGSPSLLEDGVSLSKLE